MLQLNPETNPRMPAYQVPEALGVTADAPLVAAIGAVGMGAGERYQSPFPNLDQFNFRAEEIEQVAAIIGEVQTLPEVHAANMWLHELEQRGGEYQNFARSTLDHQHGVAVLAAAMAVRLGFTPKEARNLALAGETHDLAKGKPGLTEVYMMPKWGQSERNQNETHPKLAAVRLKELGFDEQVRYFADQHQTDLQPDPERNVGGGYGGETVIAPDGPEGERWHYVSRVFNAADFIEAQMRTRNYKSGQTAFDAVGSLAVYMKTPADIRADYEGVLRVPVAA